MLTVPLPRPPRRARPHVASDRLTPPPATHFRWSEVVGAPRLLSRLFASPTARALVEGIAPAPLRDVTTVLRRAFGRAALDVSLETVYASAFAELWYSYRAEYCYKSTIVERHLSDHHSPHPATVLTELRVGRSKADVVVVDGTTTVYEIKTALDSLARLPGQLRDYSQVFEFVNVVTHGHWVDALLDTLPPEIGVLELTSQRTLRTHRAPQSNLSRLDHGAMIDALRRDEYCSIIANAFGAVPEVPNTAIFAACRDLFGQLHLAQAHEYFVDALRSRTRPADLAPVLREMPPILWALCLGAGFTPAEATTFRSALRLSLLTLTE